MTFNNNKNLLSEMCLLDKCYVIVFFHRKTDYYIKSNTIMLIFVMDCCSLHEIFVVFQLM